MEAADASNPLGPLYRPRGNDGGEITSYFNEAGRLVQIDIWKREGGGATETHERTIFRGDQAQAGVTHIRSANTGHVDVAYWSREAFGTSHHQDRLDGSGVPEFSQSRIVTDRGTVTIDRRFSAGGALSGVVISGERQDVLEYRELDNDAYEIILMSEGQGGVTSIDALGDFLND